jgi:hypothetical protein
MGVETTLELVLEEELIDPEKFLFHVGCSQCFEVADNRAICGHWFAEKSARFLNPPPSSQCVVCVDYLENLTPEQWHALHLDSE